MRLTIYLKPIDAEELVQAIDRYLQQKNEKKQSQELYKNFMNNLQASEGKQYRLALYTHNGLKLVAPQEIIRCEASNNYTIFYPG